MIDEQVGDQIHESKRFKHHPYLADGKMFWVTIKRDEENERMSEGKRA